jgi:hypothetical protein
MDWHMDGDKKLEHIRFLGRRRRTDGSMGYEKGEEIQEGVWRQVQEEAICSDSWRHLGPGTGGGKRASTIHFSAAVEYPNNSHDQCLSDIYMNTMQTWSKPMVKINKSLLDSDTGSSLHKSCCNSPQEL